MIEFFWLALHGFIIYGAWQLFLAWWTTSKVEQVNQSLDEFNEHIIICRVEEQDGMFYLWNVLDNTFIGQGRTAEEIVEIGDRLEKVLLMDDGDEKTINKLQDMVKQQYQR